MLKFKYAKKEWDALKIKVKLGIWELIKTIKLNERANVYDHLDLELTPYLKLPVSLINNYNYEVLGIVGPTQSGKTVFLQIAFADMVVNNPVNAYYCMSDERSGMRSLKEKIIDMVKATPDMMSNVEGDIRKKLTIKHLMFKYCTVYLAWSNSLATLSSLPAAKVFLDEVRLFKTSIGKESNAIKLMYDRMTSYLAVKKAQMYIVSTPSEEDDLLHRQLDVPGTLVLYYYYRCPACLKWQILDFFDNVASFSSYDSKTRRMTVTCKCKYCLDEISDGNMKRDLNSHTAYAPIGFEGSTESSLPIEWEGYNRVFFRFDSLYSPFRSFHRIYDEYVKTKDSPDDYKNFVQAWLAQFYVKTLSKVGLEDITTKVTDIQAGIVPPWTKVLLAGVDTQDTGFYVVVNAFGKGAEKHTVDAFFISHARTNDSNDPEELINLFNKYIEDRVYVDDEKNSWEISYWGLDTAGHRTSELDLVLPSMRKVIPILGRNSQADDIVESKTKHLYLVRSDTYASETEKRIKSTSGYTVAKGLPEDFPIQMVALQQVREVNPRTGLSKIIWKKTVNQVDYRFSDMYSHVALDIGEHGGVPLRVQLNEDNFICNPYNIKRTAPQEPEIKIESDANYF